MFDSFLKSLFFKQPRINLGQSSDRGNTLCIFVVVFCCWWSPSIRALRRDQLVKLRWRRKLEQVPLS